MLAAATLPALMARMTVAGPVWQSPPEYSPSKPGTAPSESVTMRPHVHGTPMASNGAESMSWPMATITRSQAMSCSGAAAARR